MMQQIASETSLRFRNIRLYDQFLKQQHCDVNLEVDGQCIPAHSCVLAASSPKLSELLTDHRSKLGKENLILKDFTIASFKFLIPYVYKGTLDWEELQPNNYKEVLNAAQYYDFNQVVKQLKSLTKQINPETVEDINELFGNLGDNNTTVLKQIITDCFGDAFATVSQVNCMLCSEKLKLSDVDHVIQHCWEHKLTANGVTEVLDDVNNDDEDFSGRGPERLQLNIEISDDYKIVDVDGVEIGDSDMEDYNMYDDYPELEDDHMIHDGMRTARSENSLYSGHFNLRPTIKTKRRFEIESSQSSKRKAFTDEFPCHICHKPFKYQKALESHLKFCKTAQEFSEATSEKRVMTKKGLIDNIVTGKFHISDESAKQEMLEYLTSSEPKEKKTWPCPLCPDLIFHKKRDQVQHIKDLHGQIKRFICDHCNKPFPTKTALFSHIRRHTGEKPFSCSTCHETFAEKKSMEDHLRRHTGEKPFLCQQCGKSFTFRQSLYRHMKFHEGKRPYECEICLKTFVLKQNLQDHQQRHNKQKPFKCHDCPQSFPDDLSLRNHRSQFHPISAIVADQIDHQDSLSDAVGNQHVEVSVAHGTEEVVETNVILQNDQGRVSDIKNEYVIADYDDEEDAIMNNFH